MGAKLGHKECRMPAKLPHRKRVMVRAALESGIPQREVGKMLGVSRTAVQTIWADPELSPDNILKLKDILPGKFYHRANKCLDEMSTEKFARLNALQLSIAAKVNLQAAREAEGLPSQTVLVKRVAVNLKGELSELQARKEKLLDSLRGSSVDVQASPTGRGMRLKRVHE